MLKEQHISLNSQSGSFGFRLLHVCQLGPFADLVRLITTPDVHISQFFWVFFLFYYYFFFVCVCVFLFRIFCKFIFNNDVLLC